MSATSVMAQNQQYRIPVKKNREQILYKTLVDFYGEDRGDNILFMSYADSVTNVIFAFCS